MKKLVLIMLLVAVKAEAAETTEPQLADLTCEQLEAEYQTRYQAAVEARERLENAFATNSRFEIRHRRQRQTEAATRAVNEVIRVYNAKCRTDDQ